MKTKFHRLLALLLALTMVLSMMPGVSLNVLADETEEPAPQPENVEPAPQPENVEPAPQAEPEHDFDWENAEWVWAEDNSSAQLVAKCTTEGCEETDAVDADVTKETVAATCTEDGSAVYTASVTLDDEEEPRTDSKTVVLPAPGHSFVEGVCTVCDLECEHDAADELGNCTVCGVSLVPEGIMPLAEPVPNYLTFTAEEAGSTVTLRMRECATIYYWLGNPGNGNWPAYAEGDTIILENIGDTVSFKGYNVHTSDDRHFTMTGKIKASGSVTSLKDCNGSNPNVAMDEFGYKSMFSGCTSLTTAPELPATTLAKNCYESMFSGCTSLTAAPELPATTLTEKCYQNMFNSCSSLTAAPVLPATNLANSCYNSMFSGCTSLTTAPVLPAETLVPSCYSGMFSGCTSLTTAAPVLPVTTVTTLASSCYNSMFKDCTSLTAAPELPVTTLASSCYQSMFSGCTSLETAPVLPATKMESNCYGYMFSGCTSLTTAPVLPATTLAWFCYGSMFYKCTALTAAPELPATNLASYCYYHMFEGCTDLTDVPKLPITNNSTSSSMESMFSGCTKLNQMTLKKMTNPTKSSMISWLNSTPDGTLYIPEASLAGKTTADLCNMYRAPANWSFKGVNADGHCFDGWQHNDTHHWHQCEIRTCELPTEHDIEHVADYAEHEFKPAWSWLKHNDDDWTVTCTPTCVCGYTKASQAVTLDISTTQDYKTYTATVEIDGVSYTSVKTEEIDYTITYDEAINSYKYGARAILNPKEAGTYNWYDVTGGGKVLMATTNQYCFPVTKTAVISSELMEETEKPKPILNLSIGDRVNTDSTGKQSVKLTAQWTVPDGYTFVEAGFKRAYSVAPATLSDVSQLTTTNKSTAKAPNSVYNLTVNMSAATAQKTVNVAAYLIYKDADGEPKIMNTVVMQSAHQ